MKRMAFTALVAAALAWSAARPAPAQPAPDPRRMVSQAMADSLGRKLDAIEKRFKARSAKPETVVVTEGELNSYLALTVAAEMPPGVSNVNVRFERERIETTGVVDLDQVGKIPTDSALSPLSLLAGPVSVEVAGRLLNQDGFGTIEWERVRVASIPLPLSVLARLVASSTRTSKQPEGFDIHAPFRLPYRARRVQIQPGRAILDF
jgi:mRNA-degrading endonuclease toxin of MazEF toxin-antitoxin module